MRIRQFKELSKDITFSVDERTRFAKYASSLKKEYKQDKIKRGSKQKQKTRGSQPETQVLPAKIPKSFGVTEVQSEI